MPHPCSTKDASIFNSLISLITATFNPSLFVRIFSSRVVLPAPKNPDKTVTGSLSHRSS